MKFFTFFLGLLCVMTCGASERFNSFKDAWATADRFPDFPVGDDKSWLDPVFNSFYDAMQPSFFKRICYKLHIGSNDWDFSFLKPLLKTVTRQLAVTKKEHPWTQFLSVKNERIAFCGPLYGSFRSLLRNLEQLKKKGFVDEQFKFTSKSHYLVFLGGVITISPYSYHLLKLVLSIMEKNPGQVIYLRGDQERSGHWKDFNVMRYPLELMTGSSQNLMNEVLPLENELNAFFDVLPDMLCLEYQGKSSDKMYCAATSVPDEILRDPKTSVVLVGERRADVLWPTRGLAFIGFNGCAAEWSLISCPNRTYRDHFGFNYDNFVLLTIDGLFIDSLFSFFSRDTRTKEPFLEERYYAGLGLKLQKDEKRTKKKIASFGSTMTLSGGVRAVGRGLRQGIEAAFMRQNEQGGVRDYFIKPIIFDDQYIPRMARANVDLFLQKFGISTLVVPQGTPTLDAYLNLVRDGTVYAFFPSTGGEQFRSPELLNLIHHRLSYQYEVRALMNYLVKEFKVKQFALIYTDDSLGLQFMRVAHETLEKLGIKDKAITDISYYREQTDFKDQIEKLIATNPEGIGFFFTSSTMARNFLSAVGTAFFVGKHLVAVSFLEDKLFRLFLETTGIRCSFSFSVPDPRLSNYDIVKEYREELSKKNLAPDSNSLEGYIAASYFIEALKKVGPPFTGSRIMAYLESMKEPLIKNFFAGTFDRLTRTIGLPVWIRTEDDKWILAEDTLQSKAIKPTDQW